MAPVAPDGLTLPSFTPPTTNPFPSPPADSSSVTPPPGERTIPVPSPSPAGDTKPSSKRPTTRAGRRAAAAAKQAQAAGKPPKDAKPKTESTPRKAALETRLNDFFTSTGTAVALVGTRFGSAPLQADGVVVIEHSASLSKAFNDLANQKPEVKAALERLLTGSVYSALAGALAPVVLAIMANHGLLPPWLIDMLAQAAAQQVMADQKTTAAPGEGVNPFVVQ